MSKTRPILGTEAVYEYLCSVHGTDLAWRTNHEIAQAILGRTTLSESEGDTIAKTIWNLKNVGRVRSQLRPGTNKRESIAIEPPAALRTAFKAPTTAAPLTMADVLANHRRKAADDHSADAGNMVEDSAPTHICGVCGALWQLSQGVAWILRSWESRNQCCDNAPMDIQIIDLALADARAANFGITRREAAASIYEDRKGSHPATAEECSVVDPVSPEAREAVELLVPRPPESDVSPEAWKDLLVRADDGGPVECPDCKSSGMERYCSRLECPMRADAGLQLCDSSGPIAGEASDFAALLDELATVAARMNPPVMQPVVVEGLDAKLRVLSTLAQHMPANTASALRGIASDLENVRNAWQMV